MFNFLKKIFGSFRPKEYKFFIGALGVLIIAAITRTAIAIQENSEWRPIQGGAYREGIVGQPIFINPVISGNQTDQDISALLYSRLTDLMEGYEIQDNGRTYLVSLREKLFWSDGQPLDADDVIFTIQLIQNPETQSPLYAAWQGVAAERISEIKVRFSLPAPYAFFNDHLARLPIIPRHIFSQIPIPNLKLSVYNLEPVGSGPYQFESFAKRDDGFITEYRLTADKNIQGQRPYIENFIFKFYENEDDLIEAFRFRKIDGFGSLKPPSSDDRLPKQAAFETMAMPRYYALFFNQNVNPLLKDRNFRYALAEAVDKERLIKEVFGNQAGVFAVNSPLARPAGSGETKIAFDENSARTKLEKIKRDNLELTIIIPNIDFLRKTAAYIQEAWQAVGIPKVNIIELNPEEILANVVKTRNYEILLFGQIPEKTEDLFPFWHSSQRFSPGLNLALYNSREVDKITERIRQELKADLRPAQIESAEALIIEDAPAIFLYSLPYVYIHNQNLKGFGNRIIINPADRFGEVGNWHVISVRTIK